MIFNNSNINSINDSADFWHYKIGVNVIPADTKAKKAHENWSQCQEKPISNELHEQRKKNGEYNKGISLIPGKIWRGPFKGKYLVAIDLDNKKAIEEFCRDGLEELKQRTLIEQTSNPEKMHIYFIVDREIPNKASDKSNAEILKKIDANEVPALEVKSNGKGIMFCANSPHQKDGYYHIISTLKPEIFKAQVVEDRIKGICDEYNIPYGFNRNNSTGYLSTTIGDLWKIETVIIEGHNRHLELLRIMESELQRNRGIKPLEDIKQIVQFWNQKHCNPPLDDKEFEKQWKQAMEFIADNNNSDNNKTKNNNENRNLIDAFKESLDAAEEEDDKRNKKTKKEIVVYKYSQLGRGPLHEAVIVNGLPFFLKYNHNTQTSELVEKIEENIRILIPPNEENYPSSPPYSFQSNEELEFFMQKAREVTKDQLFKFSKNIFSKYVDQDNHIVILLAADAIWTYFQDLSPTTHYGEGIGSNDVGKSSMGYTFEHTGYRVIKGTVISGANYNRVLGNVEPGQCVIVEDEGDNISEDSEKVKILKAGYEYNNRVPKINMNTTNQDQNWYFPYCYKIILAERSLKEYKAPGLVDRTFSFPCRPGNVKYAIKEVVSRNLNKSLKLQKLYNELLSFRKLMLCYRLVHYQDLLPNIETGLKNRDEELCKPLLQLFYNTESLKNDIIPTLETFVKQRRTRKANSLEATLYPIIKKFVFTEVNLNSLENTYAELKQKKKLIKVGFYRIWDYIKEGGIDGHYDEKKNKYAYETIDFGTLYLNSLPTIIRDKFTANKKTEDYGIALIFDVEKLEKFDDRYSDSYLKEENVKIEVQLKTETDDETGDSGDSGDFGDFLDVRSIILDNNQQQYTDNTRNNNNNTSRSNGRNDESISNSNNIHTFQKSQESQESQESPVIDYDKKDLN